MFDQLGLKLKSGFPTEKVLKNMRFGGARALTQTAKEGQAAVQGKIKGTFTVRGKWFEQSNKFGIKVKPATPANLTAKITTVADWLAKQQEGGNVFPFGNYLAIPTANVRPKGSTKPIRAAMRPRNLKNSFVLVTKSGTRLLMQRVTRGKNKGNRAMYVLVKKVHINPHDAFFDPAQKVVERRLNSNLAASIQNALDTMR